MDTATQILVIIVSSLLSITLILVIVLVAVILRLVSRIHRIADRAEDMIVNAEAAASMFKNAAGPLSFLKTVANIVDMVTKNRKGK